MSREYMKGNHREDQRFIIKCKIEPKSILKKFSAIEPAFLKKMNQGSEQMALEFLEDSVVQVFKTKTHFKQASEKIRKFKKYMSENLKKGKKSVNKKEFLMGKTSFDLPFPEQGVRLIFTPENATARDLFKSEEEEKVLIEFLDAIDDLHPDIKTKNMKHKKLIIDFN